MEDQKEKMSASNDSVVNIVVQPEPSEPSTDNHTPATSGDIVGVLWRWKRKDTLKRGSLGLRGIALFLSLVSFIIMASNKHGDWKEFDKDQEYRYLLAIAILSSLYTGVQVFHQVHELSTGKNMIQPRIAGLIDVVGHQVWHYSFFSHHIDFIGALFVNPNLVLWMVVAYLLISSTSSAIPITDRMRETIDNIFTDSSAAAIGFFFAFLFLALSAVISGYKLSTETYI